MPGVLKYRDPATGNYLPVPGTASGSGSEEVWIGPDEPPVVTDMWVDTNEGPPMQDWSIADNRYLLSGFRNAIRNGDMSIAQRGNGPWTTNSYTVDGWAAYGAGGTRTTTRTTATVTSPNWLNCAISGQSAAGDYALLQGNMESVLTFNGQQVVLTFIAKAASGTPKIGLEFYQNHGSGGSPTTDMVATIGTVTISTTATKYTVAFTVPSVSGRTLGTNGNDYAGIVFWLSAGATFASRAPIGLQSNTFSITDVQLEAGSTATPFERLPMQQQLAWCQRYFQRMGYSNPNAAWGAYGPFGMGFANSATGGAVTIVLPTLMRAVPAFAFAAASNFFLGGSTGVAVTSIAIDRVTTQSFMVQLNTGSSVFTLNQSFALHSNSTNPGYIDISAEL